MQCGDHIEIISLIKIQEEGILQSFRISIGSTDAMLVLAISYVDMSIS